MGLAMPGFQNVAGKFEPFSEFAQRPQPMSQVPAVLLAGIASKRALQPQARPLVAQRAVKPADAGGQGGVGGFVSALQLFDFGDDQGGVDGFRPKVCGSRGTRK